MDMKHHKVLMALLLLTLHAWADAQVFNSKFDTKNHPKAKGVWATVRYPTGWQSKEGERPNIVQKFTGDYNGMFVVLMLQIMDAGGPVEKECSVMGTAEFAEALGYKNQSVVPVDSSVKVTNSKAVAIPNEKSKHKKSSAKKKPKVTSVN
jgi:hypothetical protein